MFGRFGGSSPLLFSDGSSTSVSSSPLFPFENLRPGVEVVGQKVARSLGQFRGIITPLHLDPATFSQAVAHGRPRASGVTALLAEFREAQDRDGVRPRGPVIHGSLGIALPLLAWQKNPPTPRRVGRNQLSESQSMSDLFAMESKF